MPVWDGKHRNLRFILQGRRDVVVPVVAEVKSYDELGRPKDVSLIYDDTTIDLLNTTREFWVIYMAEKDAKKSPPTKA